MGAAAAGDGGHGSSISTPLLVTLLWLNTARLLKLLGQDHHISDKAEEYAVCLIPYVYGHAILQPAQRFLQAQAVVLPMLRCAGSWSTDWVWASRGRRRLPASLCASTSPTPALYITTSPGAASFSVREAWQDMPAYLSLAIPSTIMVCMNTVFVAYMIPFGLSAAASTRISNELGAGRPHTARFAVFVTLILASITALTVSTTLFSLRHIWGGLFSNEEEVIAYAATMIPFLTILTIMDGINGVFSGVARDCGWQDWGAWVNLGAYYIVGLPAAAILAFYFHFNGRGLWIGMLGALATQLVCLAVITLLLTDWNKQVENAKNRVASSSAATLPVSTNLSS